MEVNNQLDLNLFVYQKIFYYNQYILLHNNNYLLQNEIFQKKN